MFVGELGSTFEKTGVKVEDVSGVGLTSGRSTKKEGHLSVGNGLLGEIVENDEGVLSVVSEPFTDGSSGEGGEVLEGSGFGSGGGNDDRVLESVVLLKGLNELSDGRSLLSNGDVNTVKLGNLVVTVVPPLLVEDGVDGYSGLSGLTITNDQLTLSTTNGNHGVDRLETSQHGLGDGGTGENSRSLDLGTTTLLGVDGTLSVDGVTESVDYTTEHLGSNGNVDNVSGTLDCVTFLAVRRKRSEYEFLVIVDFQVKSVGGRRDLHETIVTEDGYSDVVYTSLPCR